MKSQMMKLDTLGRHFRQIRMSPADWPCHAVASIAETASLARWPNFPQQATLAHHRLGHGAGDDITTARTRATGELVEIASCCAWGDERFVTVPPSGLQHAAFGPAELSGFALEQTAARSHWNARIEGLDWIPPAVDPALPIDWMQARCLFTGGTILVPADYVLIGRRTAADPAACAVADTNGCAAGETANDACLRALFELIERDATGRWWYGQRQAPVLDHAELRIDAAIEQHLGRRGRHLVMLDLTSDLGVPTIAALAMDASGGHLGAGFATRANLQAAGRAAVTELMLMELRIAAALASPGADANIETWFRDVRFETMIPFGNRPSADAVAPPAADVDLASCIDRLKACGCRVAVMDFTRVAFGVPVVRAISPDLCHWKPRFGRARLLARGRGDADGNVGSACERNPRLLRI